MGGLTIGILNYDSETFKPIGRDISVGIYFLRDMSWLGWPASPRKSRAMT